MSILVDLIDLDKEMFNMNNYFPTFTDIMKRIEEKVNPLANLTNQLLNQMWEIKDIDDFYNLLKCSTDLLLDPPEEIIIGSFKSLSNKSSNVKKILSSSFLGKFIIKIIVGFEILKFEELLTLWKSFLFYRSQYVSPFKNTSTKSRAFGTRLDNGTNNSFEIEDQDKLLFSHLMNLTDLKKLNSNGNTNLNKNTIDKNLQVISQEDLSTLLHQQLKRLQMNGAPLPDSINTMLKNMTASQRRTVNHTYFIEYMEYWKAGDYEGSFNALHRYFDYMMSSKQKYYYHYALLALATLHAVFGAEIEALRAIDEAIMVAREAKDLNCLNYLLAWLFEFLNNKPHLSDKDGNHLTKDQILNFLRIKSKELNNSVLHSMSYINEAQTGIISGHSLQTIQENLIRSNFITLNSNISAPMLTNLMNQFYLNAQTWELAGLSDLAESYIDVGIELSEKYGQKFDSANISKLKAFHIYNKGQISEAFELLDKNKQFTMSNLALNKNWIVQTWLLKLDHSIKQQQFDLARDYMLKLLQGEKELKNFELSYQIFYSVAGYYLATGDLVEAHLLITSKLDQMKLNINFYHNLWYIKYQFLFVELVSQSSNPERGISTILNAITQAKKSNFGKLVAHGIVILSELLNEIDSQKNFNDIINLLNEVMPLLLIVDDLQLISRAYSLLGQLRHDQQLIDKANKGFSKMGDIKRIIFFTSVV